MGTTCSCTDTISQEAEYKNLQFSVDDPQITFINYSKTFSIRSRSELEESNSQPSEIRLTLHDQRIIFERFKRLQGDNKISRYVSSTIFPPLKTVTDKMYTQSPISLSIIEPQKQVIISLKLLHQYNDSDTGTPQKIVIYERENATYQGQYQEENRSGFGEIIYKDSSIYIGEWEGDQKQGKGLFILPNGSYYRGSFVNGQPHGGGLYFDAENDLEFQGRYKNGNRNGVGVLVDNQGNSESGMWINNQRDGTFFLKLQDYDIKHYWQMGKRIKD